MASVNSQFGIVDMCGFPKDNFFYYKAWWGNEPVLHLFHTGIGSNGTAKQSTCGYTPISMKSNFS